MVFRFVRAVGTEEAGGLFVCMDKQIFRIGKAAAAVCCFEAAGRGGETGSTGNSGCEED